MSFLAPLFLLGAAAAAIWLVLQDLGPVALAGLVLAVAGYGAGRAGVPRIAAKMVEILRAMAATGLGLIRSQQGERFQTWELPASSRKVG